MNDIEASVTRLESAAEAMTRSLLAMEETFKRLETAEAESFRRQMALLDDLSAALAKASP